MNRATTLRVLSDAAPAAPTVPAAPAAPVAPARRPAPAVHAARRAVLDHLRRSGPGETAEIPGRWPLTRHHLRLVVDGLVADGLVARIPLPASHRSLLALTATGRAATEGRAGTRAGSRAVEE